MPVQLRMPSRPWVVGVFEGDEESQEKRMRNANALSVDSSLGQLAKLSRS